MHRRNRTVPRFIESIEPRRLLASGLADLSLGDDGLAEPAGAVDSLAGATTVLGDGRSVSAAARTTATRREWILRRANADGTTDATFGTGGLGVVPIPNSSFANPLEVAVDGSGRYVVAGQVRDRSINNLLLAVARFNSNGQPDSAFGTGGLRTFNLSGRSITSGVFLAIDSSSRPVVALGTAAVTPGATSDIRVVRLAASNGALDSSFGSGGVATVDPSTRDDFVFDVGLAADGRVLVGGSISNSLTTPRVFRFSTAGVLDSSFRTAPAAMGNFQLVGLSDGKTVLAGVSGAADRRIVVQRLNADGSQDTSLASGGARVLSLPVSATSLAQLLRAADGSFYIGGTTGADLGYRRPFVTRLGSSLLIDAGFAAAGTARVDSGSDTTATTLGLTSAGRPMIAGNRQVGISPSRFQISLARFLGNYTAGSVAANNAVIEVIGTANPDTLSVVPSGSGFTVTLNGTTRTLRGTRISFYGLGGNDTFNSSANLRTAADLGSGNDRANLNAVTSPVFILAGSGNDSIVGSSNFDTVFGQAGNDTIVGGAGNDLLDGGDNNDSIDGSFGNDTIFGGNGNDTLTGGTASNLIDGGAGNDRIVSRNGSVDTVNGGTGTDSAQADNGRDLLTSIETILA